MKTKIIFESGMLVSAKKELLMAHIGLYEKVPVVFHYVDGHTNDFRMSRTATGGFMVMHKGSRRYGYDISRMLETISMVEIKKAAEKDALEVWRKSWEKVVARLEASGLWADLLETYKAGLEIGKEKIDAAYAIASSFEADEREQKIAEIDKRMVRVREEGTFYVNSDIVYTMHRPAQIKKMNFGKYINDEKLAEIAQALREKRDIRVEGRTSYDVSFHYRPDVETAWYSEEYKDCGNGHYYLALDATHALFYDDD